jgi:hypothetical protein
MTQEQFNQLATFKLIWEFYFKNFYVTSDHDLNGLAAHLKETIGYSTDMNCSACKEQVIRLGRNIYEENQNNYENITTKAQPKQPTSNKRR